MTRKGVLITLLLLVFASSAVAQTFGVKKRAPKPREYGNVTISNYSLVSSPPIAPVVFKHWLHRTKYTCRLCHVDLGFAMKAGETEIREEDNESDFYCGACHNGTEAFGPKGKDESGGEADNCPRCHSKGEEVEMAYSFSKTTRGFPRSRFGNRVDWLKAEEQGLVTLKDFVEGISVKRKSLKVPMDEGIKAKEVEMPDIIFSHEKHAVWNGCELCHPELFGIEKGGTKYSMQDIFDGKFCGACHDKVAFPNLDCQLCHLKEVY